jgi:hypothetical protein
MVSIFFLKETVMKKSLRFDVTTVEQTIAAVLLGLLLSKLSFETNFTVAIAAAILTYLCKDSLAPAGAFWVHTPSYTMLGAAVVLAILYGLTSFFLLAFFSVLLLSTLGGLVVGRWASAFFRSPTN